MTQELLTESSYIVKAGKLLETKQLTELEKYFKIELPEKEDLNHLPGQFVMISVPGVGEAPISVSSSPTKKGYFELVIRKAGSVTDALHNLEPGATVGIRGPFGTTFPVETLKGKDLLFVGGGCGNIPLHSLVEYAMDNRKDFGKMDVLIGCKSPQTLLFTDEFDAWEKNDMHLQCTVDQGDEQWKGHVGLITELIAPVEVDTARTYAVIVGPPIMYKFVIKELLKKNIPDDQIILSLERHMKCGVGKCGHCQIGDTYCCQDGPVFTYAQIKDNHEAL